MTSDIQTAVAEPGYRSAVAPTLMDRSSERSLHEDGFAVVDLLTPDEVRTLTEVVEAVYVDERSGFHASNMSGAHAYRREVDRQVRPLVEAAVARRNLLVDHESFTASLLVKWPTEDSAFHTHQDWTMVDEERFRTVNVWCPLVDTDEENGAFAVLPGSHRVLRPIRCSPMPPKWHQSPGWQIGHDQMMKIPVRAGQAVVFDHALLHSSPPNRSCSWRPAVAAAFKPRDAQLLHYFLTDPEGSELEVFSVGSDLFTDFDIGERPWGEVIGTTAFVGEDLSVDDLLAVCGAFGGALHESSDPSVPEAPDVGPRVEKSLAAAESTASARWRDRVAGWRSWRPWAR